MTGRLQSITVLCGGFGAARFLRGLVPAARSQGITVSCVVNTGDDLWYDGARVCPDLDIVTHMLAGRFDDAQGWGIVGDTYPATGWFRIGDRDLAHCRERTALLETGARLTSAVATTTAGLGVTLLPMSDTEVGTVVHTVNGEYPLQEWLIREQGGPVPVSVEYRGVDGAQPTPESLDAIRTADVVILAPSNPVLSIGPILALAGMRDAVRDRLCVAVTPVVLATPPRGPAAGRAIARAAALATLGLRDHPVDIARHYADLVDGFVLDVRDRMLERQIDVPVASVDTLDPGAGTGVLDFVASLQPART